MADIILQKVSRSFPGRGHAVRNLDLVCPSGKITCLVGPSGAGKTTVLRLIAGLERPDSGIIRLGEQVINDLPPHRRELAMVFQEASLYPHMTVRENLAFVAGQAGLEGTPMRVRIEETAALIGLTALLDRRSSELSGGERQLAALGKAVFRRPRILLLDEPLGQLDPSTRTALRSVIRSLQAALTLTIVHVTHDQEEALSMGDRVALVRDGALEQCDPPREMFRQPASRFVAEFFGSPSMNILLGRIDQHDGRLWFSDGRDVVIAIAPHQAGRLMRHLGSKVVMGVRPSAIRLNLAADSAPAPLRGQVRTAEFMGDRTVLHVALGSGLTVRVVMHADWAAQNGEHVQLEFDAASLCFFEMGTAGRSIL